jgi:hypothetical protein
VESTEPKQVYSGKLGFVSERTIKDIIIICCMRGRMSCCRRTDLCRSAVSGVSARVRVGPGPVLASRVLPRPRLAAAAAARRRRGRVPIAERSLGGVGSDRVLRGGGRRGLCED